MNLEFQRGQVETARILETDQRRSLAEASRLGKELVGVTSRTGQEINARFRGAVTNNKPYEAEIREAAQVLPPSVTNLLELRCTIVARAAASHASW